MAFETADRIARALLYEGYALYPYRASSLKNRQRWTFGGLFPAGGVGEPSALHSECVLLGAPEVAVRLRFLQLFGEQALEREVAAPGRFFFPQLEGGRPLEGELSVELTPVAGGHKVTVEVRNLGPDEAPALRSFAAPHLLLHAPGGRWASMVEPPPGVAAAVQSCRNQVTWPVLLDAQLMLCSPIILEDFPRVAPESATDLFDSSEIDEILVLRILTLTEEEQREARKDPRVAALLDRVAALGPEARASLHGTLRSQFRPGDKVRLSPHARSDTFDLALRGKLATVAGTERFVDGAEHCVVTVDEDPAQHRFFFLPSELERA